MKILLLLLPLLLFAKDVSVKQLFSVVTVKVEEQKRAISKKNYGYVKVDESRIFSVSPRFGGYVVRLQADKIYKYVKKGEALVSLYSPEVYKAKEEYLNSFNYLKNNKNRGMLRSAKLKLELLGVSKREIDRVVKNKKVSKVTTIYAPHSGYIFFKKINKGSAFNAKEKLFDIVNLDEVWVEAKVFEEDIHWLKDAKTYEVSFKSNDKIYNAVSTLLYPKLEPQEATLTLRLRLKNPDIKLFPGMYATIISKASMQTYLTLPRSAVIRKNARYYVFMVGEFKGEYEPREVEVEVLNNDTYIITNNLHVDDEVVNNALFMMDSDAQINGLY